MRNRISAANAEQARNRLRDAFVMNEPPDISQRQLFLRLMPEIYLLRTQNRFSFRQIADLLTECKLNLSESSVQKYYAEYYAKLHEQLQQESQHLIDSREDMRNHIKKNGT